MPPKRKAATKTKEPEQVEEVSSSKRGKKNTEEQKGELEVVEGPTEDKKSKRGDKKQNGSASEPPNDVAKPKRGKKKALSKEEDLDDIQEANEPEEDEKELEVKKPKRGKGKKKEPSEAKEEEIEDPQEVNEPAEDEKELKVKKTKRTKGKKKVSSEEKEEEKEDTQEAKDPEEDEKELKVNKTKRTLRKKKESSEEKEEETDHPVKVTKPKRGRGKKTESSEDEGDKEMKPEKPAGLMNKTSTNWETIDFGCSTKNDNGETYNLKISSWNIGGLKSWIKKDCHLYLNYENPDIICLQEVKCNENKLPEEITELTGYHKYWISSEKDGYAGVGLLTKTEPLSVVYGINEPEQDSDGRCITAEFNNYYIVGVYVPNAGRGLVNLPKRLKWNESFKNYIKSLDKKKPVIICGDMNVAHSEIDLARPKTNTKNAGFTQEERDGMTDFLNDGYVDTFRELYPDKLDMYTFWTYMGNARAKNLGWRLDYFIVSERIKKNICDKVMRSEVFGSDHCPITLFLNI